MEEQYPDIIIKTDKQGQINKKLSLVTRVKNRRHHLIHTLPTWLQYDINEIVIVDWNSNDGDLRDYVNYLDRSQVKLIGKPGQDGFNRGAAWNFGILHTKNEWVMCMDCDVKFISDPLETSLLNLSNPNNFYRINSDWNMITGKSLRPNLYGCCVMNKAQWGQVGGYLENLTYGWGWEDVEYFERLRDTGFREVFLPFDAFEHLYHDDGDRTDVHGNDDKKLSVAQNAWVASQVCHIDLNVRFDGWYYYNKYAVPLKSYIQTIKYKISEEQIHSTAKSKEFEQLAMSHNLSNRIEDIYELVDKMEKTLCKPSFCDKI